MHVCLYCMRSTDTAYIPLGGCSGSILMVSFKENSRRRTGLCFKLINDRIKGMKDIEFLFVYV